MIVTTKMIHQAVRPSHKCQYLGSTIDKLLFLDALTTRPHSSVIGRLIYCDKAWAKQKS